VAVAGLARPPPAGPASLAVTGVTAASDPVDGAGHCPGASVTLRATVATNGMPGTITYEWLRSGGPPSGGGRLAVRGGQRSATVTTGVAYDGSVPAQGVAALHVLSPASVYSPPLRLSYTCP
jgi:hypothetical protein